MKKIVLAAALLLTSVATFAQHEVGDFTIQPKVGLNIANTTKTESNYKVDFVGGAEAEYQVGEIFSVSTGLLYSRLIRQNEMYRFGKTKCDYFV